MIERRPIAPAQEKDDPVSGGFANAHSIVLALELLLDGNVVTEFSIGGSVGGLGTIGRA